MMDNFHSTSKKFQDYSDGKKGLTIFMRKWWQRKIEESIMGLDKL